MHRVTHWSSAWTQALVRTASSAFAAFLASSLALGSAAAVAGDLQAEVDSMFSGLGALGNYTTPGAFRGQSYNTYTGGSLFLRSPNKVYQLAAIQFPSARGGCGGIDVFGGSFSHISAAEFKNMLKNITAALPGVAFQLALESVSPLLGSMTKWAKGLETMINNARINSCETAKALVGSAAQAVGFSAQDACADLALMMGLEPDIDAARNRCGTSRNSILASARASSDPNVRALAPFVGNLTWEALKRVPTIDDQERELIMSIVGTVIYYPPEANRDPNHRAPTLTSINQLLYGQSDAGGGKVNIHLLACNNYTTCDEVTDNIAYAHTPFTKKVEEIMLSLSSKIANRSGIPTSAEIGFVNQTSEPVYKMLSIGNTIKGSGIAESLVFKYRDVIAADYAHTFLERSIRLGMSALAKDHRLDETQQKHAAEIRQSAQAFLFHLSREKNALYAKVGAFTAVAAHLEQLERQLRSSMPQHVMDMLGQQAAYMMK